MNSGSAFTGQLIDWVVNNGIAATELELHNHRDTDVAVNLDVLRAFLEWEG